jgi:hypothetical protein
MNRPQNEISKVSSSSLIYDRYVYDKICTGTPMSILTRTCMIKYSPEYPCQYRHVHTWRLHTHGPDHTKPHTLPHTPSPPPRTPYTLPPSLPHSPKRREPVKDARRQHADRVAAQFEVPGHETRRQSALTHSTSTCPLCPSACTFMHVPHAHAPCTCTCAPWFIHSLHMRALCMRERMCMRVRKCMHLYS